MTVTFNLLTNKNVRFNVAPQNWTILLNFFDGTDNESFSTQLDNFTGTTLFRSKTVILLYSAIMVVVVVVIGVVVVIVVDVVVVIVVDVVAVSLVLFD